MFWVDDTVTPAPGMEDVVADVALTAGVSVAAVVAAAVAADVLVISAVDVTSAVAVVPVVAVTSVVAVVSDVDVTADVADTLLVSVADTLLVSVGDVTGAVVAVGAALEQAASATAASMAKPQRFTLEELLNMVCKSPYSVFAKQNTNLVKHPQHNSISHKWQWGL
jgi:hypothetical protein